MVHNTLIVTGTLGYDYIMNFPGRFADRIMPDKIHSLSLSFLVDKLTRQFGGTAGNIAYSLKLLGINPVTLAPVGNDFDRYTDFLKKHKIDISCIDTHPDVSTSSYFVMTDREDNQIGSFYLGATKYAKQLSIRSCIPRTSGTKSVFAVLAPTEPEAMVKYVKECRSSDLRYLYDPAFQIGNFSPSDLKAGIAGATILIGNDYEIALIEKKLDISHEELILAVPILITTLGSKGSVIETQKESIHIKPAKAKNVNDPTGAGDAYRAGFLAGYVRMLQKNKSGKGPLLTDEELIFCGQMGSVAAVYTVEKYGTVTHTYTPLAFRTRFKENYGDSKYLRLL